MTYKNKIEKWSPQLIDKIEYIVPVYRWQQPREGKNTSPKTWIQEVSFKTYKKARHFIDLLKELNYGVFMYDRFYILSPDGDIEIKKSLGIALDSNKIMEGLFEADFEIFKVTKYIKYEKIDRSKL